MIEDSACIHVYDCVCIDMRAGNRGTVKICPGSESPTASQAFAGQEFNFFSFRIQALVGVVQFLPKETQTYASTVNPKPISAPPPLKVGGSEKHLEAARPFLGTFATKILSLSWAFPGGCVWGEDVGLWLFSRWVWGCQDLNHEYVGMLVLRLLPVWC